MKGYTTINKISAYLLTKISEDFQPQVLGWIESIESYIDKKTGRNFKASTSYSTRKYDGEWEDNIIIDDCVDIEWVKINGEKVDYIPYPANYLPYNTIKLVDNVFIRGRQNVEVSAKWGYSVSVPKDIEFITTVLVSGIIQHSLSHEGEVSSVSFGRYNISYKDERHLKDLEVAKDILNKYIRYL